MPRSLTTKQDHNPVLFLNHIRVSYRLSHGKGSRWSVRLLILVLLIAGSSQSFAAEGAWTVEQMNRLKDEWPRLVGTGIRVEGRLSSSGRDQFRLQKCEISFRAPEEDMRRIGTAENVEAYGKIESLSGRLIFVASSVKAIPDDSAEYRSRANRLQNGNLEDWFELGKWAAQRGAFYEDAVLAKLAKEAYREGIQRNRQILAPQDAAGLLRLADLARQHGLEDALQTDLEHQGAVVSWQALQKTQPFDVAAANALLQRIAKRLPESTTPLLRPDEKLMARYRELPHVAYQQADAKQKPILHRNLYAQVTEQIVSVEALPDGSNADEIAQRLTERLPDFPQLAANYRKKSLDFRMAHAETMTKAQIEQLAADLNTAQRASEARTSISNWLQARAKRLNPDDSAGYLALADDALTLAKEESLAVTWYAQADRISKPSADARRRLMDLGYQLIGQSWIKRRSGTEQAETTGHGMPTAKGNSVTAPIAAGMTRNQLRALLGEPYAIQRIVLGRGQTEVWSYGPQNQARLVVVFHQHERQPEPQVTRFGNIP